MATNIDCLAGYIAGLFLACGINPEETAGKMILNALVETEKDFKKLKDKNTELKRMSDNLTTTNAELMNNIEHYQTENLKLKRKITLVTKYLNENIKLRNHTYGMDYTVKSRPLIPIKKILEEG